MQCGIRNTWIPGQASPYTVGDLRVSHRTENISSYEVKDSDGLAAVPAATLPDSAFLSALGTAAARMVPLQTGSLAQRATVDVPFWPPCFYWFFGSCLGAMMKQVCWHSRRSKADRGLPEARMAELLWKKPPSVLSQPRCKR